MKLTFPKFKSKKTRLLLAGALLLVLAGAGFGIFRAVQARQAATANAAEEVLQTATVKRGDLVLSASGTGVFTASATADLAVGATATLTELNVSVGDPVKSGQVLARLHSDPAESAYRSAQLALANLTSPSAVATAQSDLAAAETQVDTTLSSLKYLISPTVFKYEEARDAARTALDQANTAVANANTEANQAAVKTAQDALTRAETNVTKGWYWWKESYCPDMFTVRSGNNSYVACPSDSDISGAWADYHLAVAALKEAQDYLTAITGGEVPQDATGTALAAYESARDALASAKDTTDSLTLTAPFDGVVTSISAAAGDQVQSGTLITIASTDPVSLSIYLDETDFDKVKVGYPVNVVFDSLPDLTFTGKVVRLDPSLYDSGGSKLIQGLAELDPISPSVHDSLLLGMNASVDVIGGSAQGATLVSVEALHEIDTDQYGVYLLKNGTLTFTPVEIGIQDSFNAVVLSGLEPGDVVSTGLLETN